MEKGGFERYPERTPETIELQRNPEQVFDSDIGKAESEALELQQILAGIESMHERHNGVELHIDRKSPEVEQGSGAATIKIVWCDTYGNEGTMLQLDPIVEGHGAESGIFGYKGRYGIATRKDESFEFNAKNKPVSIEELFGQPDADLRVKPTVERWAIGKDELSISGDESQQTLYMGLGFLFMSEKWMYIGFHEVAGHFPNENDENMAWTKGKKKHAEIYRKNRKAQDAVVNGESGGLFGVLEKPRRSNDITVGRIERFGITSHYQAGNAKIPDSWERPQSRNTDSVSDIMREFKGKIEEAQYAFDEFFQR